VKLFDIDWIWWQDSMTNACWMMSDLMADINLVTIASILPGLQLLATEHSYGCTWHNRVCYPWLSCSVLQLQCLEFSPFFHSVIPTSIFIQKASKTHLLQSALMLLVGWQEGHPACKKWVVGCWRGYLSGARCRFAYGPADATATHYLLL